MEYWEYPAAFFAMFFTDVFYAYYIQSVQNAQAIRASFWAATLYILGGIVVLAYTSNPWLLIPAVIGAFAGTYVGVRYQPK
jgi:hypothetical protein